MGSFRRSPRPLAGSRGPNSKGKGGKRREEGRGRGREGRREGKGRLRKGKEGDCAYIARGIDAPGQHP